MDENIKQLAKTLAKRDIVLVQPDEPILVNGEQYRKKQHKSSNGQRQQVGRRANRCQQKGRERQTCAWTFLPSVALQGLMVISNTHISTHISPRIRPLPIHPDNVPAEYELILKKKSKLSRSQREQVEAYFLNNYCKIT